MTQRLPGTEWGSGRENYAICVGVRESRRGLVSNGGRQAALGRRKAGVGGILEIE